MKNQIEPRMIPKVNYQNKIDLQVSAIEAELILLSLEERGRKCKKKYYSTGKNKWKDELMECKRLFYQLQKIFKFGHTPFLYT